MTSFNENIVTKIGSSPAASSNKSKNCTSVSSSAGSGMLLMSAIRSPSLVSPQKEMPHSDAPFFSAHRGGTRSPVITSGMQTPWSSKHKIQIRGQLRLRGHRERLLEVRENVVNMFDPDAQPNHLRLHADLCLLFRRELPMRRRGWMACQRFGIAHVHHPFEQSKRIEALAARFKSAFDAERQQRHSVVAQIFFRHRIQRAIRKSRVAHPLDHPVIAQKFRDATRILHMPLDAQGHCLEPLQQQESVER